MAPARWQVASGGSNSEDADPKRSKIGWCLRNPGTPGTPPSFFSMDRNGNFQAFDKIKVLGSIYPVETTKKNSGCLGFQVVGRAFFLTQWWACCVAVLSVFFGRIFAEGNPPRFPKPSELERSFFSGVERFLKLYKSYNFNIHFFKRATVTWGQEKKAHIFVFHTKHKHQNEKEKNNGITLITSKQSWTTCLLSCFNSDLIFFHQKNIQPPERNVWAARATFVGFHSPDNVVTPPVVGIVKDGWKPTAVSRDWLHKKLGCFSAADW